MRHALDLSEDFFNEVALDALKQAFPNRWDRIAVGLTGNGSECFGFDDELSIDHDWGAELFFWLTEEDYRACSNELSEWFAALKEQHPEYSFRRHSAYGIRQVVYSIPDYYTRLTGFPEGPKTIGQWRAVPESNLAMAVNGRVFLDELGLFTQVRDHISAYYPEDLRLKKMAARCMALAQTGQYNYERSAKRGADVTKEITMGKFVQEAISMVYIINRTFMPYYKWAFAGMETLPVLGKQVAEQIRRLYRIPFEESMHDERVRLQADELCEGDLQRIASMESTCQLFIDYLRKEGLSDSESSFLADHGETVQSRIRDEYLRTIPAQYD